MFSEPEETLNRAAAWSNSGSRPLIVGALASSRASRVVPWALALLVLVVAVVLYTRFSLADLLSRDEAIAAYGAQQWAHGVPFYTSIFDAKGPLSSALGGVAVWV